MGNDRAIGEAYHITSDNFLTWNAIYQAFADAEGVSLNPVYIPSAAIAQADPEWGAGLLRDKAHSVIFDDSKIKSLVPEFQADIIYQDGAQETAAWYRENPAAQVINQDLSDRMDHLIAKFG